MSDPYRQAATAYAQVGRVARDPRQVEADVLLRAANRLDEVRQDWSSKGSVNLESALLYNRKLWTILAADASDGIDRLPTELRNNIANLGVFVFKRSFETLAHPSPEKLDALIEINRSIAAGLLTRQSAAEASAATTSAHTPAAIQTSA